MVRLGLLWYFMGIMSVYYNVCSVSKFNTPWVNKSKLLLTSLSRCLEGALQTSSVCTPEAGFGAVSHMFSSPWEMKTTCQIPLRFSPGWERCASRCDYRTHDSQNLDFLLKKQALNVTGHPGAHLFHISLIDRLLTDCIHKRLWEPQRVLLYLRCLFISFFKGRS